MKEEKINKEKEIIEVKKKYLEQIEKFDSKIYFTFLTLFIASLVLYIKEVLVSYWWPIGLCIITLFMEKMLDTRRKREFEDLIKQIKEGSLI